MTRDSRRSQASSLRKQPMLCPAHCALPLCALGTIILEMLQFCPHLRYPARHLRPAPLWLHFPLQVLPLTSSFSSNFSLGSGCSWHTASATAPGRSDRCQSLFQPIMTPQGHPHLSGGVQPGCASAQPTRTGASQQSRGARSRMHLSYVGLQQRTGCLCRVNSGLVTKSYLPGLPT